MRLVMLCVFLFFLFYACTFEQDVSIDNALTRVHVEREDFKDEKGRYVYFNGVNVAGDNKVPVSTNPLSYVGKPFKLKDANRWFSTLRSMGFNSIRLGVIWEAIEHEGKGIYDQDYLEYIEKIVEAANKNHIYVLVNFHENMFSRWFSVNYNSSPALGDTPEDLEYIISSLFPDDTTMKYNDRVAGDGAPRWAVEACAPEKDLDSKSWGTFRYLGSLGKEEVLSQLIEELQKLFADSGDQDSPLVSYVLQMIGKMKKSPSNLLPFEMNESSDMIPSKSWFLNNILSIDVQRCYAAFYAGDKILPKYRINGKNVKDYLQEGYVNSWVEVVKRIKKYPNIIGYDLINEPSASYITLPAMAAYISSGLQKESLKKFFVDMLGEEKGMAALRLVSALNIIPVIPDNTSENQKTALVKDIKRKWGLEIPELDYSFDLMSLLNLNVSFERQYLLPVYERLGKAILAEDSNAIFWLEDGITIQKVSGPSRPSGGFLTQYMYKPDSLKQVVYTPHWYPDIYPFPGINTNPRDFSVSEWSRRDFTEYLKSKVVFGQETFGTVPTVFGEFGTYFNYNGISKARSSDYEVSTVILDNYYEGFEQLFLHRMLWCFSARNSYEFGDQWNHEDFSVIDPDGKPRGEKAVIRPVPHFLSGKPLQMYFYSPAHYYIPQKGKALQKQEFYLSFESKETESPTEIFVPKNVQYKNGFYVWLSDGWAYYDDDEQMLYYYPFNDNPTAVHEIIIRAPNDDLGQDNRGWDYFYDASSFIRRNIQ